MTFQSKTEQKMVYMLFFNFFVNGAVAQSVGSFLPIFREQYGLSYDFAGVLLSLQTVGSLLSTLLVGIIPIYFGRKKSVLFLGIGLAISMAIFLSNIGAPIILAIGFFLSGSGRGATSGFASTMMSTLKGPSAGMAFNILHGCAAIGAFLAPLILVMISGVYPEYGWLYTIAILLVLAISQQVNYAVMPIPPMNTASKGKLDLEFMKNRKLWIVLPVLVFYMATEYSVIGWVVTYFQDAGILSGDSAQLMNSLFWGMMFVGRMSANVIGTKIAHSKYLMVSAVGAFVFVCVMLLAGNATIAIIGLTGLALSISAIFPMSYAVASSFAKGNDFASGLFMFIGSIGGIISQISVGVIAEHFGIRIGMSFVGFIIGGLMISVFFMTKLVLSMKNKEQSA